MAIRGGGMKYNFFLVLVLNLFLSACSSGTSRIHTDLETSWNALKFILFIAVIMGIVAIVKKVFGKKDK
jgi:hypothetical protein